jgi:hypothetical protein
MNARSVLRYGIPYALSATVTGLLLHATDASAVYWEEVTATACGWVFPGWQGPFPTLSYSSNGSVGGTGTLVCPLQEEYDHGPASAIDVYVRDDSPGSISAQACATISGPTGEYCGAPTQTSGTGWKIMHPDPGLFWTVYGYYYLRVTLPENPGNGRITGFVARY